MGISANAIDSNEILEYWYSPFTSIINCSEDTIFADSLPIVIMGGRGTGKTMILRYFSYDVQKLESKKNNLSIIKHLCEKKSIGVYIRFGIELKNFEAFNYPLERWKIIFTHYFELSIALKYTNILIDLLNENQIAEDNAEQITSKIKILLEDAESNNLFEIKKEIEKRLIEVNKFRENIVFGNDNFNPKKTFKGQSLTVGLVEIIKECIPELKDITFLILLDEYENFKPWQQSIINTMLKFANTEKKVTYRIGMRLEGFHTHETITPTENLKVNRDYKKIVIEEFVHSIEGKKKYHQFLKQICEKRLSSVPIFKEKGLIDITKFLGNQENFENEAKEIVRSDPKRLFKEFLNECSEDIIDELSFSDNPLLEMLNILWANRKQAESKEIKTAMNDYLAKRTNPLSLKYKNDYTNKYKFTLLVLLASLYKTQKKYYSFNTFAYLSSGIVMYFIELCRETFESAYFYDRESLLEGKIIDSKIQARSALKTAKDELETIKTIENNGTKLYNMVQNLGNIFREIHLDKQCKYPETNQFAIISPLDKKSEIGKNFNTALMWTLIQRKSKLQQTSIGKPKGEVYTLNRIYSPIFQISYRTRGGYIEEYDEAYFEKLLNLQNIKPKAFKKNQKAQEQLNLWND